MTHCDHCGACTNDIQDLLDMIQQLELRIIALENSGRDSAGSTYPQGNDSQIDSWYWNH